MGTMYGSAGDTALWAWWPASGSSSSRWLPPEWSGAATTASWLRSSCSPPSPSTSPRSCWSVSWRGTSFAHEQAVHQAEGAARLRDLHPRLGHHRDCDRLAPDEQ